MFKPKVYPYGSSHLIDTSESYFTVCNGIDKVKTPGKDVIQATTLIQLSGGIDSTYVLWKWLKDNPKQFCVVQHIEIINFEGRSESELISIDLILRWLDSQGLKNYFYIQSKFDYGNMTIISDAEICGFHAGIILKDKRWKDIKKVLLPIYDNTTRRESGRLGVMSTISRRKDYQVIYPLKEFKKIDIIKQLPGELLDICWYCRTPVNGKTCGNCHTCKEVNRAKQTISKERLLDFISQKEFKNE